MKPPVYKTVTTKEGVMLFVDENAEIKAKEWFLASDRSSVHRNGWNHPLRLKPEFPFYHKIIAQPLESNISGIPYYELTPQERPHSNWNDWLKGSGFDKWNKVDKADFVPPETSTAIVFFTKAGDVFTGHYKRSVGFVCYGINQTQLTDVEVTHWRNLDWPEDFQKQMDEKDDIYLRQPMKIVSASPIIDTEEYLKTNMNAWIDNPAYMQPETYNKPTSHD